MVATKKTLRHRALDLLAMREHSQFELQKKLLQKGFGATEVDDLIESLRIEGLLCDQRFAESYVRYRAQTGHGPIKIRAELHQRGISAALADQAIDASDIDWWQCLTEVWDKKYAHLAASMDRKMKEKCMRFLYQRGFDSTMITKVLADEI